MTKQLAEGHAAGKWWSQGLKQVVCDKNVNSQASAQYFYSQTVRNPSYVKVEGPEQIPSLPLPQVTLPRALLRAGMTVCAKRELERDEARKPEGEAWEGAGGASSP